MRNLLSRGFITLLMLATFSLLYAQDSTSAIPEIDKSPLDVSYMPDNYPLLKIQDKVTMPLTAKIVYSRPQLNGRTIFGNLVEYGKVWRFGANECTQIEFFTNVVVNKVKIKKGIYSLYAIPELNNWTFIINKETDTWGSFRYDAGKDIVRVKVPVTKLETSIENFSLYFKPIKGGYTLNATWDKIEAVLPIYFN